MPVTTESSLRSVTVYRSGALVERALTLKALNGVFPHEVEFGNLPLSLQDSSVQVAVEAEDGSVDTPVARDVRVALALSRGTPNETTTDLERSIRRLKAQELSSERRLNRLHEELAQLAKLKLSPRPEPKPGEPPLASPLEARLAFLDFVRERAERLQARLFECSAAHKRLTEQRQQLESEQAQRSSAGRVRPDELCKALLIGIDNRESPLESVRLVASYLVPGARWLPSYALYLEQDWQGARFAVRALVAQNTGEDWRHVPLTLSTALPQQWSELPELKARRLGRRQPARPRRPPAPAQGAEELFSDFDRWRREHLLPNADLIEDVSEFAVGGAAEAEAAEELDSKSRSAPQPSQAPFGAAPAGHAQLVMATAEPIVLGAAPPQATRARAKGGAPQVLRPSAQAAGPTITQPEAEPEVDPRWLDFGSLRLPDPTHPARGRVQPLANEERYEMLLAQELSIHISITQVLAWAQGRADAVSQLKTPARHVPPKPQTGFDFAYRGQYQVDVDSDGEFHSVPLAESSVKAQLSYVSVPRETQAAYRRIELDNTLQAPLLPGPVDVYVDGAFLTTGEVKLAPRDGRIELWLGVEPKIKIARNTRFKEQVAGLLRGQLALIHELELEVENHLARPASLEVRERVPVSREGDDDVRVSEHSEEPAWQPFEQAEQPLKGGQLWKLSLEPGAKQVLRAEYTIEIPSKHQLLGGNRRES